MELALVKNWWSLVLRGGLGLLLGLIAFAWPGITLAGLVILFAAYALIDGVVSIAGAIRAARAHERWRVLVIEGIIGVAAAAVTMLWPAITTVALVLLIGAWAVITGAMEIAAALRLRQYISGEWLMLLSGIASLVFGILVLAYPLAGGLVIALWFGAYVFIFGAIMVTLGFRLRSLRNRQLPGPMTHVPVH